ncbi:MAG: thiaminase II [Butyricicoccus pullicaecorum]|nr:thiaminase II [Butyricicoccus pullicaecorum]
MKTSARLLESTKELWQAYYDHPFVLGIQNGDLDKEKFRFYNIQDYLYLLDYAKVFAIGMTKTKDPEVMHIFAKYIAQIMDSEMNIHKGYMHTLNISKEELRQTKPALACRSYTSYMLACAQNGGAAEALTAILACALSYEHIAKEMLRRNPAAMEHPFYGDWVQMYAAAEYAEENIMLCDLIDCLTETYTEEQMENLKDIFYACARYEKGFWDMAWKMEA